MMKRPRHLLCSDLDGTLLGDAPALARFSRRWADFRRRTGAALAYVSGRSVESVTRLLEETPDLPRPDFIAGDVGTALYLPGELRHDDAYHAGLAQGAGWDRPNIESIVARHSGPTRQPDSGQGPLKCSWFWKNAPRASLDALEVALLLAGLRCRLVYSADEYLDILPAGAGKHAALRRIAHRLRVPPARVLVAGDTGNDVDMFNVEGVRGVAVGNAHPELLAALDGAPASRVLVATAAHAAGVEEGCRFAFGAAFDGPLGESERKA